MYESVLFLYESSIFEYEMIPEKQSPPVRQRHKSNIFHKKTLSVQQKYCFLRYLHSIGAYTHRRRKENFSGFAEHVKIKGLFQKNMARHCDLFWHSRAFFQKNSHVSEKSHMERHKGTLGRLA